MIRKVIVLLLLSFPVVASAQIADTIIHFPAFSLFVHGADLSADTINRKDPHGNRQGKWLEYDSTLHHMIRSSRPAPEDTMLVAYWGYTIKWTGYYIDNKKQGVWTSLYGPENQEIKVYYKDGEMQFPIIQPLRNNCFHVITYNRKKKKYQCMKYNGAAELISENDFDSPDFIMPYKWPAQTRDVIRVRKYTY